METIVILATVFLAGFMAFGIISMISSVNFKKPDEIAACLMLCGMFLVFLVVVIMKTLTGGC